MPENLIGSGIIAAISSILGAAAILIGFKPRIERCETDIQKMETVFETQGRELGEIKGDIKVLLERREINRSG